MKVAWSATLGRSPRQPVRVPGSTVAVGSGGLIVGGPVNVKGGDGREGTGLERSARPFPSTTRVRRTDSGGSNIGNSAVGHGGGGDDSIHVGGGGEGGTDCDLE